MRGGDALDGERENGGERLESARGGDGTGATRARRSSARGEDSSGG